MVSLLRGGFRDGTAGSRPRTVQVDVLAGQIDRDVLDELADVGLATGRVRRGDGIGRRDTIEDLPGSEGGPRPASTLTDRAPDALHFRPGGGTGTPGRRPLQPLL